MAQHTIQQGLTWLLTLNPESLFVAIEVGDSKEQFAKSNWGDIAKLTISEVAQSATIILLRYESSSETMMGMVFNNDLWVSMPETLLSTLHQIDPTTLAPRRPKETLTFANIKDQYPNCLSLDHEPIDFTPSKNVALFPITPPAFGKIFEWLAILNPKHLLTIITIENEARLFEFDNWNCINSFLVEFTPCLKARFVLVRDNKYKMGAEYRGGKWHSMSLEQLRQLHTVDPTNYSWCEPNAQSVEVVLKEEYPDCPIDE